MKRERYTSYKIIFLNKTKAYSIAYLCNLRLNNIK